ARPSLSRELTNLRNMGIIDFHRSSVTILDVAALQKMAGR
ncbi:MAG TPA: winged helix-turn-helix domain-containing protein, partial [Clostridiales bacterium]|nr:winged helix-turn-helix domain-containing protein [Clostridiales bacterium]